MDFGYRDLWGPWSNQGVGSMKQAEARILATIKKDWRQLGRRIKRVHDLHSDGLFPLYSPRIIFSVPANDVGRGGLKGTYIHGIT